MPCSIQRACSIEEFQSGCIVGDRGIGIVDSRGEVIAHRFQCTDNGDFRIAISCINGILQLSKHCGFHGRTLQTICSSKIRGNSIIIVAQVRSSSHIESYVLANVPVTSTITFNTIRDRTITYHDCERVFIITGGTSVLSIYFDIYLLIIGINNGFISSISRFISRTVSNCIEMNLIFTIGKVGYGLMHYITIVHNWPLIGLCRTSKSILCRTITLHTGPCIDGHVHFAGEIILYTAALNRIRLALVCHQSSSQIIRSNLCLSQCSSQSRIHGINVCLESGLCTCFVFRRVLPNSISLIVLCLENLSNSLHLSRKFLDSVPVTTGSDVLKTILNSFTFGCLHRQGANISISNQRATSLINDSHGYGCFVTACCSVCLSNVVAIQGTTIAICCATGYSIELNFIDTCCGSGEALIHDFPCLIVCSLIAFFSATKIASGSSPITRHETCIVSLCPYTDRAQ